MTPYYTNSEETVNLYLSDCLDFLKNTAYAYDMVFADPPYFLSKEETSCNSGNKGEWDIKDNYAAYHFTFGWLDAIRGILKENGTIWVSGTFHNIYMVGYIMQHLGFRILNNITWEKPNPPPNLACKCFTHSTESIIWAAKSRYSKYYFNYKEMKELNGGKQMKDVWVFSSASPKEKIYGKHPTQKPEKLLERIILSSTKEGDLILDPFVGSGTTGVVARRNKRLFVGVDKEKDYLDIAIKRINQ